MNIILFSRKQVNHRPEQLRTMLRMIDSLGLGYAMNEELVSVVHTLLGIEVDADKIFHHLPHFTGDDVVVTYGGDGTLLEAVGMLGGRPTPVVGINCGRLGYLTADDGDGIELLFERIAHRELSFEHRSMLHIEGDFIGDGNCLALNEVAIHRHGATMVSVETLINGNTVATYHGDGLVVSTPTGSTAYSLSAGGPVVDPACRCFVLSPLAPHNLTMRPVVVPDSSHITLRLNSRGGEAFLSADNRTFTLHDGATIELRLATEELILATPHNNTFYDALRDKMMWGVDKR
ncbi:MAG: NAD(+)/NADH kinase [Alistipes sp.]|nr:NAD(+)/NADH kinase [Alistipes sp.]